MGRCSKFRTWSNTPLTPLSEGKLFRIECLLNSLRISTAEFILMKQQVFPYPFTLTKNILNFQYPSLDPVSKESISWFRCWFWTEKASKVLPTWKCLLCPLPQNSLRFTSFSIFLSPTTQRNIYDSKFRSFLLYLVYWQKATPEYLNKERLLTHLRLYCKVLGWRDHLFMSLAFLYSTNKVTASWRSVKNTYWINWVILQ